MRQVLACRSALSAFTLLATAVVLAAGCTPGPTRESALLEPDALEALHEAHDYFTLRERLDAAPATAPERHDLVFYRASVLHAFNEPSESNILLDELLARSDVDPGIRHDSYHLRRDNHLRLHDYAGALAASRTLLADFGDHDHDLDDEHDDARNTQRLLEVLQDVPPQAVDVRGDSVLLIDRESGTGLRIRAEIEGAERLYVFDTGANYSVLMRSEAESLGLEIREAGIDVGNSVGGSVSADIAIASRLTIGSIDYRHVVFLVLPDELLTFLEVDVTIPGILGFPVLEAMGEIRILGDRLEVPHETPQRDERNLAFEQLEPLIRVGHGDGTLLCRFDTGANRTDLYEPFYRRFRDVVEATGTMKQVTSAGVGEKREIDAYVLPRVELGVGTTDVTLHDAHVLTAPLSDEPDQNFLDCNLGRDVLAGFDEHVINFRSMSLVLRREQGVD